MSQILDTWKDNDRHSIVVGNIVGALSRVSEETYNGELRTKLKSTCIKRGTFKYRAANVRK